MTSIAGDHHKASLAAMTNQINFERQWFMQDLLVEIPDLLYYGTD